MRLPRLPSAVRASLLDLVAPLPRYLPAFGVVALLACMLVPLPTGLVDLLLSLSLALALLLLVACLGLRRSADFLTFPSLLLFTTLARLALNVQTTRLILSDADAGAVIDAFSALVVRDEMIVGVVIFAIITAVQYLVIARGAERVAEVAARFALDGLPGEQAAIDADLRGGVISPLLAGRRRAALIERSRFYGAMDGAIRFVKGDAIAGLAITAINLVGGVGVGVLRRGLDLGESLALYGRLTVGDGLVAQIPALLVALAAGVLVARVDRAGRDRADRANGASRAVGANRAGDAGRANRALAPGIEPTMLLFPAALLFGLALVDGMPRIAFGITAGGLVVAGLWYAAVLRPPPPPAPRHLVVGLSDPTLARSQDLRRALSELRQRSAAALAIDLPEFVVAELAAPGPSEGTRRAPAIGLSSDGFFGFFADAAAAADTAETAGTAARAVDGEGTPVTASGGGGGGGGGHFELRLGPQILVQRALDPLTEDRILVAVFRGVMAHAESLIDLQDLEGALEVLRGEQPAVVREALRLRSLPELLGLLRGLLRERIPMPPLDVVLGAITSDRRFADDAERGRWLELLRQHTAGFWLPQRLRAQETLGPLLWARPDADAEDELRAHLVEGIGGRSLGLDPRALGAWRAGIAAITQARSGRAVVILTTAAGRPAFAALLRGFTPFVPVISLAELAAADLPLPSPEATRWLELP